MLEIVPNTINLLIKGSRTRPKPKDSVDNWRWSEYDSWGMAENMIRQYNTKGEDIYKNWWHTLIILIRSSRTSPSSKGSVKMWSRLRVYTSFLATKVYQPITREITVGNTYRESSQTVLDQGFHMSPHPAPYVQYSSRSIGGLVVGAQRVFPNGARGLGCGAERVSF